MTQIMQWLKRNGRSLVASLSIGTALGVGLGLVSLGLSDAQANGHTISLVQIATEVPPPQGSLNSNSTPADISALMLNSHNKWQSLRLEAVTTWHASDGDQTVTSLVEIEQMDKVRVEGKQVASGGKTLFDWLWLSDGANIYVADNLSNRYTVTSLPPYARSLEALPPVEASFEDIPVIVRHPIASLMQSQLADYLYPVGLMQRPNGTIEVIGEEQIANRNTVILDYRRVDSQGGLINKNRFWIDVDTGIILKAVSYGGNSWDDIYEETAVVNISMNLPIDEDRFRFSPPATMKLVTPQDYYGVKP